VRVENGGETPCPKRLASLALKYPAHEDSHLSLILSINGIEFSPLSPAGVAIQSIGHASDEVTVSAWPSRSEVDTSEERVVRTDPILRRGPLAHTSEICVSAALQE
jgi:hypothetical protein